MAHKYSFEQLCRMSDPELEAVFEKGLTPDFKKLVGFEFKGYNTPKFAKLMGIQKFKKGFFFRNERPFGYNVPVMQNGLYARWICEPSESEPKRFGFYSVNNVFPHGPDNLEPHALLLNYGHGENSLTEGGGFLRDFLVQVDPENEDIYLGKAFIALGKLRKFSNFFVLERDRETWVK